MDAQSPIRPTFARRLAERLRQLDLSKYALAHALRVHESTVGKWINEDQEPEYGMLVRVAREVKSTVDWLLGVDQAPDPPMPTLKTEQIRRIVSSAEAILAELVGLIGKEDSPREKPVFPPPSPQGSERPERHQPPVEKPGRR